MPKTLVVAEKPSVAKDLAAALPGPFRQQKGYLESEDYLVTWAVGHLLQLAAPERYDERFRRWRLADLPILPERFQLESADDRAAAQFAVIQKLLRRPDVDRVVNACDAGREGELIFAYILQAAGVDKPVERLWVSSLTRSAIREGFRALRPGQRMAPLEAAARSRAEADWLVGMNATRAATIRGRGALDGVVSLGRVQTPTLAIVAQREREIQAFVPEPYWVVDATFDPAATADGPLRHDRQPYRGRWFSGDRVRLPDADSAAAVVAKVQGRAGRVASAERRERSEQAPLLYDLTSLQRDANRRFGFSASRTLRAAQSLYEARKSITYPRTASRYLTSDLAPQLQPTARTLLPIGQYSAAASYVLGLDRLPLARVVDDAKVGDHHAIIPTLADHDVERFSGDEQRIFDLVARRFLAVFYPPARFALTTIVTEVESETFRSRGRVTLEPGWRAVYGGPAEESRSTEDDDEASGELPPLSQDQAVHCLEAAAEARTTKPPPRFTEATLLSAMEGAGRQIEDEQLREAMRDRGLGTPATRAETIETLLRRGYLERLGKDLRATPKALQVVDLLNSHPLTSPELTGDWEQRLADIESGRADRQAFMRDIAVFTRATVEQLAALDRAQIRPERAELGPCPRCGAETGAVIRENSRAFGCTSWQSKAQPGCGFVIWKVVAGRRLSAEEARQLVQEGRTRDVLTGFRSRAGRPFRARLLLGPDGAVAFDLPARPSPVGPAAEPAALERPALVPASPPKSRASRATASRSRRASSDGPAREPSAPAVSLPPFEAGADPVAFLQTAGFEVIDRRLQGGALWVVDAPGLEPALAVLRQHGLRFSRSSAGGRSTGRRPAWFTR